MENKTLRGTAKVLDGKLIITDEENISEGPWIVKGKGVSLLVDEQEVKGRVRVSSESKIEIIFNESKATRELNINVSEDKMVASISINYSPEVIYTLEDTAEASMITLNSKVKGEKFPPKFTRDEILKELKAKNIVYGIDIKMIDDLGNMDKIENIIVARGKEPVEPIDDILEVYFDTNINKGFKSDQCGNVDFKSIGSITSVKKDDILAKRTVGKEGTIGINLFSQPIQPKKRKVKDMMVKTGCKFKDKDTIVSTMEGKPQVKGCIFQVNNVHEVLSDVDITTGDINFIGDVIINADVKEGMKVKSGNTINIKGNAIRCSLWSEGDMQIIGSAISSTIKIRSEFAEFKGYLEELSAIVDSFHSLYKAVIAVKESGDIKAGIKDCDIISLVIKSKFPLLTKIINKLLSTMVEINDNNNELFRMLKIKYANKNYILISGVEELIKVKTLAEEKIKAIEAMKDINSDATIGYIQDCTVICSGSITVSGKGIYKSNVYAEKGIYFTGEGQCELRGGKVKAENEIKVKVVGSPSGVMTEVIVGKEGHIYCDMAYLNTKFIVGNMETIVDETCKSVHVYIDKNRDLIVDKFKI
ncbi:FapA family protein [Clostridium subterminale]|uniref:FapA family protein n=1 Tax=Clostridium subterminale TaxID=1550 RepID=A0ABN1KII1_CLOSU